MSAVEDTDVARARERRRLLWLGLIMFVVVLVAVVAGMVMAHEQNPKPVGAGTWALLIGIPFGVALLTATGTVGIALWRRRRGSNLFARSPLWELSTQKQRRHLVRALRRGDPIDPDHHDLALRVARDVIRRRGLVWGYVALAVIQLSNVFLQDGWWRWLYVACTVLFLGVAGYWTWLVRRMRSTVHRLEQPS